MTPHDPLSQLCARLGVQRSYTDGLGQPREASTEALLAVISAMGHDLRTPEDASEALHRLEHEQAARLIDPVTVLWLGNDPTITLNPAALHDDSVRIDITLEDGGSFSANVPRTEITVHDEHRATLSLPEQPQVGFHDLTISQKGTAHTSRLIVAPHRCFSPTSGTTDIAFFLPLYALCNERNLGVGTYDELGDLLRFTSERRATYFGTLPLLSTFLDDPFEPSPYAPVSRSIFSELFIDPHAAARDLALPTLRTLLNEKNFTNAASESRAHDLVSYRETWSLVRRGLEASAKDIRADAALSAEIETFLRNKPLISDYADFRASLLRVRRHHNTTPADERWLYACAQWLVARQLDTLRDSGLYLDLPVGSIGSGFDARRYPDLYARTVSLGAPPDALFRKGQTWGFPPQIPSASRAIGHAEFIQAVETHCTSADALRIDHAAGLHRCYWVPNGFDATDGVYVHSPREDYFAILSALSHRHGTRIIGENLGTIPHEVNESIAAHNALGMRIAQFELGDEHHPLPTKSDRSLVALNTHDMPPFHAFWTGADIELNTRLGVFSLDFAEEESASREQKRARILDALIEQGSLDDEHARLPEILEAILIDLASKRPDALAINLEDLWLEPDPQNIPGTVAEYPNWRRKASKTLDEIRSDPEIARILDRVIDATRSPGA